MESLLDNYNVITNFATIILLHSDIIKKKYFKYSSGLLCNRLLATHTTSSNVSLTM